ncbi:DNA-binding transcriptional LysR family regulator [Oxalobacteraceae bacterium GrIS 1.11]
MDRLRALEVFVEVVRKDGFARAAESLGTSPANVTRYISDLESHLCTRLLNRSSRKMSLTASGEALFERAKSILDDVAEAEAIVSSATMQPRGLLRINAPLDFGIMHLAPLWPRFMQHYPDVQLDICLNERVVDLIDEGYDMAIRLTRGGQPAHLARQLATSRNIVCAAPAYLEKYGMPATPAELLRHRCIGHSGSADEWDFVDDKGAPHPVKVACVMHSNNGETARAAAVGALGVICQVGFLLGADLRAGRLLPLLPGFLLPDIAVLAMYPNRRHLSAKVRVMIDFLVDAFKDAPPWELPQPD